MRIVSLLVCILHLAVPVWANPLDGIDADAMSGDPMRIRKAIAAYEALQSDDVEVQWRLVRAYFNYYDELAERNRRGEQKWAAERGYTMASAAYEKHPDHGSLTYYYAVIGLCFLDFHRVKAVFVIDRLFGLFEKARRLVPDIDDAGPDRNLAILYHEVPGWPLGRGDSAKALSHIEQAVRRSPERAANRIVYAKLLAEHGRYDEGRKHLAFIRAGKFKVSSEHWRRIYLRRVEEVAADFPPER